MEKNHLYEEALQNVRRSSCPSDLKIVDMKVCDLEPPFSATIIKLITNQGLEGYGQVREGGSRVYALMLKRLLLGENPCNVDKIFRRIKQFGYHSHQAGGVSGVEMALWDLAGKAYGVPAYQLLGGKFRDQIRVYCDTDIDGKPDGKRMGAVLKERIEKKGYTIMKMDLSIMELLYDVEGALTYPTGELKEYMESLHGAFGYHGVTAYDPKLSREEQLEAYARRNNLMKRDDIPGPSRGIHITELGLDILEQYVKDVRDVVGYQIPIAVDHFGPIGVGDCIRLGNRLEKYNMAWLEDMVQDITVVDRVCWVTAQVTIPAGGSVTVTASMAKGDSYDFYCGHTENQGVSGYDLVTALGSNLTFTGQTAALTGWEEMEIVRQNFGFDPENGVTSVTLDPGEEHYYLEVRRIK